MESSEVYEMPPGAIQALPTLARRPYFAVPDRSNEEVLRAFVSCFTSAAGQAVLDRLYWSVMMTTPANDRAVGKQDLFREIIDSIQRGIALQHSQIGGTHGGSHHIGSP